MTHCESLWYSRSASHFKWCHVEWSRCNRWGFTRKMFVYSVWNQRIVIVWSRKDSTVCYENRHFTRFFFHLFFPKCNFDRWKYIFPWVNQMISNIVLASIVLPNKWGKVNIRLIRSVSSTALSCYVKCMHFDASYGEMKLLSRLKIFSLRKKSTGKWNETEVSLPLINYTYRWLCVPGASSVRCTLTPLSTYYTLRWSRHLWRDFYYWCSTCVAKMAHQQWSDYFKGKKNYNF